MADKRTEKMMKEIFLISNKLNGKDRLIYLMSSTGERIIMSSTNSDTIVFYSKTGDKEEANIHLPHECIQKMELDCDSNNLVIMTKEKVYLCNIKSTKMNPTLIDSEIGTPTCIAFSKISSNLAIGTSQGGLMLINLKTQKKHIIASKHPKRISLLSWSSTDALISKSDDDTIHVSKENGEVHEEFGEIRKHNFSEIENMLWIENSTLSFKIRCAGKDSLSGKNLQNNLELTKNGNDLKLSKEGISKQKIDKTTDKSALSGIKPNESHGLSQSSTNGQHNQTNLSKCSNHLLVIIMKSGKELSVICNGDGLIVHKVSISNNQGRILGVYCCPSGELIVCTSRGFVLRIAFKENGFSEIQNDRFFQNSFEVFEVDYLKNKAYTFGDCCLKVFDLKTFKEDRELRINFDKNHSSILSLVVSQVGGVILVNTNNGSLIGYMAQSDQIGKMFNQIFAVKVSLNELSLKNTKGQFDQSTVEQLENCQSKILKFPGSEILDFICIHSDVIIAQHKSISCYTSDIQLKWKIDVNSSRITFQTDNKSKLLVITPSSLFLIDINQGKISCTLNAKELSGKKNKINHKSDNSHDKNTTDNLKTISLKNNLNNKTSSTNYSFENSKNYQNLSDFMNSKINFNEYFTIILDKNVFSMYDNVEFNLIHSMILNGSVSNCFVDEKSMEFYFYETSENKLMIYRKHFNNPVFELMLCDKKALNNVLFDFKSPNMFCLFHESGNVYSVCKKESHYKSPVSYHTVREILQPSDLSDNSNKTEMAITLLDPDILPVKLSDGFLFCLEKGISPTGCHLSSHSFKMGSFGKFSESISPKINTMLNQQSKMESLGNKEDKFNIPQICPQIHKNDKSHQFYIQNQFHSKMNNELNLDKLNSKSDKTDSHYSNTSKDNPTKNSSDNPKLNQSFLEKSNQKNPQMNIIDKVNPNVNAMMQHSFNSDKANQSVNGLMQNSYKSTPKKNNENESLSQSEKEYYLKSFFQTVELNLFSLSFKAADVLCIDTLWNILAVNALKNLDLEISQSCYQKIENWSMSYYIKYLKSQNKKINELRADVAVILCDYEFAKSCFLQNGKTNLAIELSMNLQEYSQALELAQKEGLTEYEIMASYELAEIDSKNEELIKSEGIYLNVLKKLEKLSGIKTLNSSDSSLKHHSDTAMLKIFNQDNFSSTENQNFNKIMNSNNSEIRYSDKQDPYKQESNGNHSNDKENGMMNVRTSTSFYKSKCKKFNYENIFKSTIFGLTSLYLRQGSLIKASDSITKLSISCVDELEELASIAYEYEHYTFATDIYCKIGCTKKELEVRLMSISKQSQQSKTTIDDFSKIVRSKMNSVNDSEILLKLALFFQEKDKSLATELFGLSDNTYEFIKYILTVLKDVDLAERKFASNKENCQKTAFLIADFFLQNPTIVPDAKSRAIKYFLFSGRKLEALKMAFENNAVETYCQNVHSFDEKEASMLAQYYAGKSQFNESGKYFLLANQYEKSLLSFVKSRDFDSAIDLVFKLKDDELFDLMVQVFAGETVVTSNERIQDSLMDDRYDDRGIDFMDGFDLNKPYYDISTKNKLDSVPEPVDPIYLFKLYLKFGKIDQANTIALAIIDRELIDGSYKSAYDHGVSIQTQLNSVKGKLTTELRNKIVVLHSYVLVKKALKFDNHLLAALLLNRVCSFLHYLPKKETDILTSAVIEATKAGLKSIAYTWALTLCKPQYRTSINPKLKDKIEKIALKPVNSSELTLNNYFEVGWKTLEVNKSSLESNKTSELKNNVRDNNKLTDISHNDIPKYSIKDTNNPSSGKDVLKSSNIPSVNSIDHKMLSGFAKCPICNHAVSDSFSLSCNACCNNFVVCIATGKALLAAHKKQFLKCNLCYGIGYEDEIIEFFKKESSCPVCDNKHLNSFQNIDLIEIGNIMKH